MAERTKKDGAPSLAQDGLDSGLKQTRSQKWYYQQYWVKNRTLTSISEEVGWSIATLSNWFNGWWEVGVRKQGTTTPTIPKHAKLTTEDLVQIKTRAEVTDAQGEPLENRAALAREFGISRQRLYAILAGDHRRL